MSERALVYSTESFEHRLIVLYEAAAIKEGSMQAYLIRSLLSENKLVYETVEKVGDHLESVIIEKPGPTGLMMTTTAISIDPETETRCVIMPADDSDTQTKAVIKQLAKAANQLKQEHDFSEWHALQTYHALSPTEVVVPYAEALAELIPAVAVRLRRDVSKILSLIKAHAILHQGVRARDGHGRIIAKLGDYEAVRRLLNDLLGTATGVRVSDTVRQTREAVDTLIKAKRDEAGGDDDAEGGTRSRYKVNAGVTSDYATMANISKALKLDRSAAWRRVRTAMDGGYLKNIEEKTGRGIQAKIALGEAIPDKCDLLPSIEQIQAQVRAARAVAA
jgi:hypothetical protein